jgi:hypothetical protein
MKPEELEDNLEQVHEPINTAPPEIRAIIEQVLQLEKDKLYQRSPRGINDDILSIIKSVVQ